jgi:hypothetical protein
VTSSPDESPLGWLERGLEEAKPEDLEPLGLADEAARAGLVADLRTLGLAGILAALASADPVDPAVAREAPERVASELAASLGEGAPRDLPGLLAAYAAKKGARGKDLLRRAVGRSVHDLYDLQQNGLTGECTLRALDLVSRGRDGSDARDFARSLARLSRVSARAVLGHLEEQIALVHRLATEDLTPAEIDRPLLEFAPRVFARRIPSMLRFLLPKEPRVRLSVVLWGRFRGLVLGKGGLVHALDALAPEKPFSLVRALAAPGVRARVRELAASEANATDARALEAASVDASWLS